MKKGFTLIELLVVIAILAVLAAVVVLVLNPAELLRQGRDSARISDLSSLNSAISLYLADVTTPVLGACTKARMTADSSTAPFIGSASTTTSTVDSYGVSSTPACTASTLCGWVDINFTAVTGGSPLGREPRDPVNSTSYFYAYGCSSSTLQYEVDANMESIKYRNGGGATDVESKDGGDNAYWYEVGSSLTL